MGSIGQRGNGFNLWKQVILNSSEVQKCLTAKNVFLCFLCASYENTAGGFG